MVSGIICEYNPFHNGHAWQLAQVKARTNGAPVVCVMSGNMVQRGELALLPKHIRAKAAVLCGADLVLELPLVWALSSAEGFAKGGVGVLAALGCVDTIAFGSESGDAAALRRAAEALASPALSEKMRIHLDAGLPYGAARQRTAEELAGAAAQLLKNPNDMLAAEYMAAALKTDHSFDLIAIKRLGAEHDAPEKSGNIASASLIRGLAAAGEEFSAYVPPEAASLYRAAFEMGLGPVTMERAEGAILSRLRWLDEQAYLALPGGGEGLGQRLYRASRGAASLEELCQRAKTKRYPMARIRRLLLWAALGLKDGDADGTPPYIRVLAANETGRRLLRNSEAMLPVITKPAAARGLEGAAKRLFELEAAATDLYTLALPSPERRAASQEWTTSPVMI